VIDISKLRADTPACKDIIHFNNAGASLMPNPVIEAVQGVLHSENTVGGYEAERLAAKDLADFYSEFASLLNTDPDEIAYVENATRAWDMAFYGLDLQPGDRIITHGSEYVSNYLAFRHQARRRELHVDLAPSDSSGQRDIEGLEKLIGAKTRLIAITHVPTQGGLVNPVAEIGAVARRHGLIYMLDACQSVGQIAVDVQEIGCDVLSGTGRKFLRGPRGTGFLYVRRSILEKIDPPFIDLRSAIWTSRDTYKLAVGARRFENWESYVAGLVGLMTAVRYAIAIGLARIEERVATLADILRDALRDEKGVTVHDLGVKKCGIVTFLKEGTNPSDLATKLRNMKINVSVSDITSARLDFEPRGLSALTRASVHYFNTEDEVSRFVRAVSSA
jgi:cysteine desulfurase / selenocysteine lyase